MAMTTAATIGWVCGTNLVHHLRHSRIQICQLGINFCLGVLA